MTGIATAERRAFDAAADAPVSLVPPRAVEANEGRAAGLRVALFSGNYNCVRDGANKALNRLVRHLLDNGAAVRVYSPTSSTPAFPPAGDVVSAPSVAIPSRPEYRFAIGLPRRIRDDIRAFAPNLIHVSAPDLLGSGAQRFARRLGVPSVASQHTRFETYFDYYGMGFVRRRVEGVLKRFYARSDMVLAPNEPMADGLRQWGLKDVRIWSRGVDRDIFSPVRRDMEWRRGNGFADDEAVVLFFGRLVREKGLDTFEAAVSALRARGHRVRPLVIGEGPARRALEGRLGNALFTGHLEGGTLGGALASADILINPSLTEAFGNVNLEAMAAGLAVVSADVGSAQALIENGRTGLLVDPASVEAYADAIASLIGDPQRRERLGLAAAEAASAYDWSAILDRVIDHYRAIVGTTATAPDQAPRGAALALS